MKMGDWLGGRTWIALAASLLVWAGMGLLGAGLMLRGLVSEMAGGWLTVSWLAAALVGGVIALKGKSKRLLHAAVQSALLYGLLWAMAFSLQVQLSFDTHGVQITAAVFGGSFIAALLPAGKGEKKRTGVKRKNGRYMANSTKAGKKRR